MLRHAKAADLKTLLRLWGAAATPGPEVTEVVSRILLDVERRGDRALLEWTERLDGVRLAPGTLRVGEPEIESAWRSVEEPLLEALREAALRVERFAAHTLPRSFELGHGSGIVTGARVEPVDSAGLYVPGGKASYPSTVLMNALPARVAGVPRRVMATPAGGPGGRIHPLVLAAARECGVHEIYRLGGAQAVAALAFGTRSVRPVAVVTGPGNAYVAEAKRQVMGRVGIESLAGPSELLVVADETAEPDTVALRMMAQAEHDERTRVAVVSHRPEVLAAVAASIERRLVRAKRREILRLSLPQGLLIEASSLAQALRAANELAPEHLELHVRDPRACLEHVARAGAVFLGAASPTALGDYGGGPNHTLPTGRTARFASALSGANFVRVMTTLEVEPPGDPGFLRAAERLARAEGLWNHAETLRGAAIAAASSKTAAKAGSAVAKAATRRARP